MQGTPGDSSSANQRTPLVRNRSSRRPRPLRRRSSGFDQGLYSASAYKVIEAPLKRSQSQASLNAGTASGDVVQQAVDHSGDDKDALTGLKLLLLTVCMAGVQFTCKSTLFYSIGVVIAQNVTQLTLFIVCRILKGQSNCREYIVITVGQSSTCYTDTFDILDMVLHIYYH
jgi:hypothetical protein